MTRILLVDDHPSIGVGTKSMIEQDVAFTVDYETSAGRALGRVEQGNYDLLILDLHMPEMSGLKFTQLVRRMGNRTPVLIYTGFDVQPYINQLIESEIVGFVSKTATREQLQTAIYCALREEAVIPISLLRQLRRPENRAVIATNGNEYVEVNDREQEILNEIALGKGNKEIAQILMISQRTVEYSLTRLFEKLKVNSRSEAIVQAKQLGFLTSEGLLKL